MSTRPTRLSRLLAAPLSDDRGQVHRWARMNIPEWPLTGPVLPKELRAPVAAAFRAEQERRAGKAGFRWQMAVLIAPPIVLAQLVGMGTMQALNLGRGAGAAGLAAGLFLLAALAVLAVATPLLDRAMRWMWGPSIRHAMLASRRCPACTYDLTGSLTQPDGCTICPECGAAWRMEGDGVGARRTG